MKTYLFGLGVVTVGFSCYVQFSKSMGNFWIRRDSENKRKLMITNLLRLMIAPLRCKEYWKISMLPINYIFIILLYTSCYTCIRYGIL